MSTERLLTACALLSDHGYLLFQAFFQALQSYSWGFVLIQSLSKGPTKVQVHANIEHAKILLGINIKILLGSKVKHPSAW